MSNNVTLPGTGAIVATDDIGGVEYQRIKLVDSTEDSTAPIGTVSNPLPIAAYGELIEAIEAMRFAVAALTKTIGYALPNAAGQPIMEVRQATAGNLAATVSGTVTANIGTGTLSALTNQTQIGGFNANDQIPALMHMQADNLRRNITVT